MSVLDRDKARTVLAKAALVDMTNDEILDEIEQYVRQPAPLLVYGEEDFRARVDAEAKIARIAALCDQAETRKPHEGHWHYIGTPAIRAVLDGGAA